MMVATLTSCQTQGQQIIYDLPESVTTKAREHMGKFKSPDSKFIAQLSKQNDGRYVLFIINYDFAGLENFKLIEEMLIKQTSRVIRVDKILLPLITDEDFLFADFGTEKMKDGRTAKKKIVFNSESYAINFDKNGKLYSE